ncbi:MAG: primosomal protein N', partial [Ignavibacteria bacterium]|nr:primosomal protein N' [Ignavibacteria bacterium]
MFVKVALNLPINSTFTYKVGENFVETAETGKRVLVSFGNKILTGIIVEICETSEFKRIKEIKDIIDDEPIYTDE